MSTKKAKASEHDRGFEEGALLANHLVRVIYEAAALEGWSKAHRAAAKKFIRVARSRYEDDRIRSYIAKLLGGM